MNKRNIKIFKKGEIVMGLRNEKRPTFLTIQDGRFRKRNQAGEDEFFNILEGDLSEIRRSLVDFQDGDGPKARLELDISDDGEIYQLSMGFDTGLSRAILNSLSSLKEFSGLTFKTYQKEKYSRVFITQHDDQVKWSQAMPELGYDLNTGEKDDTERRKWTLELFYSVEKALNENQGQTSSDKKTSYRAELEATARRYEADADSLTVDNQIADDDVPF